MLLFWMDRADSLSGVAKHLQCGGMNRLAVPIGRLASRKRTVMMTGAMTARTSTASKNAG
jgi:hypothetical protein